MIKFIFKYELFDVFFCGKIRESWVGERLVLVIVLLYKVDSMLDLFIGYLFVISIGFRGCFCVWRNFVCIFGEVYEYI